MSCDLSTSCDVQVIPLDTLSCRLACICLLFYLVISKPSVAAGPTLHGQCIAEVWVATSFELVSYIEVISIFSPTEKV